ncbi:MAG: glycoside hydrolase family 73 protein [Bernardetiaceae bacterium]
MIPAIKLFWGPEAPRRFQFSLRVGDTIYTFLFVINDRMLVFVIGIMAITILFQIFQPTIGSQVNNYYQLSGASLDPEKFGDDALGYAIAYFNKFEDEADLSEKLEERFLVRKQLLVTRYLLEQKASRLDQLSNHQLLELNHRIGTLFKEIVLSNITIEPHVYQFFTDTTSLRMLETSLMEQVKFHVPASIKLAQAALETAYGRRVVNNNYFGIKDKKKRSGTMVTTEYYTPQELAYNRDKVISSKKIKLDGRVLYKCTVRDHFTAYQSPWESFRAHSEFLHQNKRYAPLFAKGKDYAAWADAIGSTKYGGVGYATSPIYGQLLKKIIRRYQLHLLDY